MGVSYGGERMIGNLPFSLFNGQKERKKREEGKYHKPKKRTEEKMKLAKQGKGEKEREHPKIKTQEILLSFSLVILLHLLSYEAFVSLKNSVIISIII